MFCRLLRVDSRARDRAAAPRPTCRAAIRRRSSASDGTRHDGAWGPTRVVYFGLWRADTTRPWWVSAATSDGSESVAYATTPESGAGNN